MKKSTIVRTICLAIVLINMILKATGHELIHIEENQVAEFVEMIISVIVIILSWWKNNSFTQSAIDADKYLEYLKNMKEEDE